MKRSRVLGAGGHKLRALSEETGITLYTHTHTHTHTHIHTHTHSTGTTYNHVFYYFIIRIPVYLGAEIQTISNDLMSIFAPSHDAMEDTKERLAALLNAKDVSN